MANRPSPENVQRAIRVDRELDAKVLKRFKVDEDMTVKDAYILALQFATRKVELDPEDLEKIAADKRAARKGTK